MPLSEHPSIVEELKEVTRAGSPTSPSAPIAIIKDIVWVRRAAGSNHRRILSTPGASASSELDIRARTLNGGAFEKMTNTSDRRSVNPTGRMREEPVTAVASSVMSKLKLASESVPGPKEKVNAETASATEINAPKQSSSSSPPPTIAPIVLSSIQSVPHDASASHPQTEMSPTTPDVRIIESPFPPPASFPLSPPHSPINLSSSRMQASVVVADLEKNVLPSKKRSGNLPTPSAREKGKGREISERRGEGRAQTMRRGFIGPGGIIHKITSSQSLSKVRTTLPFTRSTEAERSGPATLHSKASPPTKQSRTSRSLNTPNSVTFLRPPPPAPRTPPYRQHRQPVFAPSSARTAAPFPSSHKPLVSSAGFPSRHGQSETHESGRLSRVGPPEEDVEMIEIPRFKKRELNLGLVRKHRGKQRALWLALGGLWVVNGLLSLMEIADIIIYPQFFDVNVIYILVQCSIHPSSDTNGTKLWQFAAATYAILWALSTIVVWLGWELGYEFWRRWRLDRPAIEPIYFSLPASLHLSLKSYDHFIFLLHIRTSPLGTQYAKDIIPETCHALIQLLPGVIPLLPRAAIAVVALISFWKPNVDVHAAYGGQIDETADRDLNFFRSDHPGELTNYSKGVLLSFTIYIAFRLAVVIASAICLWVSSGRPLGGVIGKHFRRSIAIGHGDNPSTPRKRRRKSSFQPRDPNLTRSPQKSWVDDENSWDWAWKERTRARVQDAFQLCIIRLDGNGGIFKHAGETGTRQDVPWAKSSDKITEEISMKDRGKKDASYSATDFSAEIAFEGSSLPCPPSTIKKFEANRLESILDPTGVAKTQPSSSRASTNVTSSTDDLFYTAPASMTPAGGKKLSVAEATRKDGVSISTYKKRSGWVTEFGVKEENGPEGGDDESTGLLSADTGPRQSMLFREWSGSTASRLSCKMSGDVSQHSHFTTSGEGSSSGSISTTSTRRRSNTTSHPHALDLVEQDQVASP
ncbi:hypothetical protein D1P53_000704 [Cryptococcus gattii VGV]|nr:hypothetical protein D1P53_000704 [Cryptococcus gattii VGV]